MEDILEEGQTWQLPVKVKQKGHNSKIQRISITRLGKLTAEYLPVGRNGRAVGPAQAVSRQDITDIVSRGTLCAA